MHSYNYFFFLLFVTNSCHAFQLTPFRRTTSTRSTLPPRTTTTTLWQSTMDDNDTTTTTSTSSSTPMLNNGGEPDNLELQWKLFQKYHAQSSSWKGIWTTYDYIGDVLDEVIASVNYLESKNDDNNDNNDNNKSIQQINDIVIGATQSDCTTCFDSMEIKSIPIATYTQDTLLSKNHHRLAANSMIIGPKWIRSTGVMATELVLVQDDARVRVLFQHAPVWERDIIPGSCPPQGLKLARCMIVREVQRDMPPTPETEAIWFPITNNNNNNNNNTTTTDTTTTTTTTSRPRFYRPVPPYAWHKQWAGTSWTWGPTQGNRGWSIDELPDDWHGNAPVELWNLRLPGGLFVQCPRIITDAEVALCRMAWLVQDDTLLRVEAGITALQPILSSENNNDEERRIVGFEPPSLTSLRCDILYKKGDLEGEPMFVREMKQNNNNNNNNEEDELIIPAPESMITTSSSTSNEDESDSIQAIRDAMSL